MPETAREEFNKKEIGARIKRLRKEAGLRQWQLAQMVGATQPAIHMYERGVLPEPKRLLQIARIGNTTVEWILTGRHWKDGSEEMNRAPDEIYRLAYLLKEYDEEQREILREALEIIGSAVDSLRQSGRIDPEHASMEDIARQLKAFSESSRKALAAALQVHQAVSKALVAEGADRLKRSGLHPAGRADQAAGESGHGPERRKGMVTIRPASMEPVRGHIFRLDGSLLIINEILRDKDLRAEFSDLVARMQAKLQTKKDKVVRLRRAQRGK